MFSANHFVNTKYYQIEYKGENTNLKSRRESQPNSLAGQQSELSANFDSSEEYFVDDDDDDDNYGNTAPSKSIYRTLDNTQHQKQRSSSAEAMEHVSLQQTSNHHQDGQTDNIMSLSSTSQSCNRGTNTQQPEDSSDQRKWSINTMSNQQRPQGFKSKPSVQR